MPKTTMQIPPHANACLMLADGKVFFGNGIGAEGITSGEICFNTAMTGYQEVLTDSSFAGQIITFTFPHIGNVGCNEEDIETVKPSVSGLVVRELPTAPSNFRSTQSFDAWLKKHGITGIHGVDTRALTRYIRHHGAQNAAIMVAKSAKQLDLTALQKAIADCPDMHGRELAASVTTSKTYEWTQTAWKLGTGYGKLTAPQFHVVAIDYGEKLNILRRLAERGCKVTVVPARTSAEDILKLKPDGIFLSNGPGDPAATGEYAVPVLKKLIDSGIPIFGICLGHQLLGLALGGKTEKLEQGHRGANHPVKNLETGAVEITSQNHGFAVIQDSLPKDVKVTHVSLFDGTVEGLRATGKPLFTVQYHPESSPGPHDSQYLFDDFVKLMKTSKADKKYA
jgi:carbamoyl-phosphate synthase small subunit